MRALLISVLGAFIFTMVLAPASALAKLDSSTKKEIDAYLDSKMGEKKSWLPSMKGEYFELQGEFELEFVSTQNEQDHPGVGDTANKKPHFQLDKIILMPIVHFGKNNLLKLELEFKQGDEDAGEGGEVNVPEFYFQSNFLLGENAPLDMDVWLRIGRDERFVKPKRITESYPILGTVFWRDDELQLILGVDTEFVYWRGSWGSGMDMGSRAIGEDGSDLNDVLQDDNNYDTTEAKRELGTGIGFRFEEDDIKADLLTYYFNDKMNSEENSDNEGDVEVLAGIDNYYKLESGKPTPDQNRFGTRLTLDALGAQWMSEYLYLQDGLLKRHGWYTMLAYTQKLDGFDVNGRKWLVGVTPLVRFDNLDVIIDKSATDERTWDRWSTTVALIIDVIKHVKLKTEFRWNKEHTGSNQRVDNDELLIQLEAKF